MSDISTQIQSTLADPSRNDESLADALRLVLKRFASETGTIHRFDAEGKFLHMAAHAGLPQPMIEIVKVIPIGKGIAGQTALRKEPVTICNLQTDDSGVAKPGARQTGVGGALCVPIWKGQDLVGTIGIGTQREYEYTADETRELEALGRIIGKAL